MYKKKETLRYKEQSGGCQRGDGKGVGEVGGGMRNALTVMRISFLFKVELLIFHCITHRALLTHSPVHGHLRCSNVWVPAKAAGISKVCRCSFRILLSLLCGSEPSTGIPGSQ